MGEKHTDEYPCGAENDMRISLCVAAATAVAAALLSAAPATATEPAEAAGRCTVNPLPEPAGAVNSEVHGGEPRGRWLVGSAIAGGVEKPIAWKGGKLQSMADSPLASYDGVDRGGNVAGWGRSGGHAVAGAIVDGSYVGLASPAGALHTYAAVISGKRAAGQAELETGPIVPVLWKLQHPDHPILLPLPSGYYGFVTGVGAKGRVVVDAMNLDGDTQGFVFTKKLKRRALVAPDDATAHLAGAAGKVAAAWVEGAALAIRFDLRTGVGSAVATPIQVSSINKSGVLGGSYAGSREPGLVIGGASRKLPTLVDGGFGTVSNVSRSGNPAGISERTGGNEAAVTWACSG